MPTCLAAQLSCFLAQRCTGHSSRCAASPEHATTNSRRWLATDDCEASPIESRYSMRCANAKCVSTNSNTRSELTDTNDNENSAKSTPCKKSSTSSEIDAPTIGTSRNIWNWLAMLQSPCDDDVLVSEVSTDAIAPTAAALWTDTAAAAMSDDTLAGLGLTHCEASALSVNPLDHSLQAVAERRVHWTQSATLQASTLMLTTLKNSAPRYVVTTRRL